jgi:hypothetical protein
VVTKGCPASLLHTFDRKERCQWYWTGPRHRDGLSRGYTVKWSVGIETEGDRVLTREEVVELADAIATSSGIATGIGTNRYGAQLLVDAGTRAEAIEKATGEFTRAVAKAGLPVYPIVRVEAVGEFEEFGEFEGGEGEGGEFEGEGGEFEGPGGEGKPVG